MSETVVSETVVSETVVSETVVSETVVSETVVSETVVSETVVSEAVCAAAARLRTIEPAGAADPQAWRDAAVIGALESAAAAGDDDLVLALAIGYDPLLTRVPQPHGDGVRLVAVGNDERRRRGSFATPPGLAAVLARHALPLAEGPVVDPACGSGALLEAAADRLVDLGLSAARAVELLHGVDVDPLAVRLCRARLLAWVRRRDREVDVDAVAAGLARRVLVGDALLGPSAGVVADADRPDRPDQPDGSGLAWHRAFPDVLAVAGAPAEAVTGWRGGFAAVVANPPWERIKVFRREAAGAELASMRRLRAGTARSLRGAGRHPLTGSGELNAYLPFVETCWRLLAPDGHAGLLVPAGIASDRSATRLVGALLEDGSLASIHLLAAGPLFEGVSARVGAAVLALRGGPLARSAGQGAHVRPVEAAEIAVGVQDPASPEPARCWSLARDLPRRANPNTGTLPLCGSARDAALLDAAHRRWPVLVRRDDGGRIVENPWQVRLVTPLHMTRDARHFHTEPGPGRLPLWEAKHAWLLDHRGGSRAEHRYWVDADLIRGRWPALTRRGWLAGYRNVTTAESPRTLLPTPLPVAAVGNSLPLIDAPRLPLLLTALASLPVDHLVRQKHAGANLNFFKLEQAAVPGPQQYERPAPWQPEVRLDDWLLTRFAASVRWDASMPALAAELAAAGVDVDAAVAGCSREVALAEIDAAHAVLLDWDRDDLDHVLSAFPALAERERRAHGRYITRERVLAAYDRLCD